MNTNDTTTTKRGRPLGSTTDRTLKLIGTTSGRTVAEVRAEALRLGTEKMINDLKATGIDIRAIENNITGMLAGDGTLTGGGSGTSAI